MVRLDKFLSENTTASRSDVKKMITAGRVSVDGVIIKRPESKVSETSEVLLDGKKVTAVSGLYYMLNKPGDVITASRDKNKKTVLDLFPPEIGKHLFAVGRLDLDTEGLLILTDDGDLCHRLESPRHHVKKTYIAKATGELSKDYKTRIETGIEFKEFTSSPAEIEILSHAGDEYVISLTISEGKFHQVKRMLHAIGVTVTALKRVSVGSLKLDESLAAGEYRELTESEIGELINDTNKNSN